MIHIQKLTKHYNTPSGGHAGLRGIDLQIPAGSIYGVIGKSGAGKSTLIRCMNRLENATSGSITVDGTDITTCRGANLRQQRRKMSMVFQHFNLLSAQTVYDNIALPLKLIGTDRTTRHTVIQPLLALTGLADKAEAYPAQLSGGQKQRVAIARALVTQPKVLLCDEATSALDPHTTEQILNLLKKINQELGLTIVLVSHEMDVVKKICDHVAVLDHGQLVEHNDLLHIFTQPQHAITRSLVNAVLHLELPDAIEQVLHDQPKTDHAPLIRFTFVGQTTTAPFLSEMTQRLQVSFNILQAHIDYIHGQPVGFMLAQALADAAQLQSVLQHAQDHGFNAEVLGYVA